MIDAIIGIVAICFLLIYIVNTLDSQEHYFLQLIFLIAALSLSLVIPKIVMDSKCEPVLNQTITNGNITNYVYDTYCYDSASGNSPVILIKSIAWLNRIFWMYVIVYLSYRVLIWIGWVVPGGKK